MTDLLTAQSEIKSRRKVTCDQSGQFARADTALARKVAADRMKSQLKIDVEAMEHAAGYAWVHAHPRPLPNADRLACLAVPVRVLPLFDAREAA